VYAYRPATRRSVRPWLGVPVLWVPRAASRGALRA